VIFTKSGDFHKRKKLVNRPLKGLALSKITLVDKDCMTDMETCSPPKKQLIFRILKMKQEKTLIFKPFENLRL
jgi:hypothetical protein